MAAPKEIIYLDVDEEITGIIDKVRGADQKIVALVLPKRATVLQSIVNMKLLKRTADDAKKHIVLITSDTSLLPLAGTVGFYVAKTLQTRPVVPPPPQLNDAPLSVSEDAPLDDEEDLDVNESVGALSGMPPDEDEEIEVGDAEPEEADVEAETVSDKKGFNKRLKVPNFERFRLLLIAGAVVLIGLIIGLFYALTVLPKASITIKTDTTSVNSDVTFTASTTSQTLDLEKLVVPATQKQAAKSDKQQVATTGQKDEGTPAKGTMTLTNCINDGQAHTVPAGTPFSSGQFTFLTDSAVTLDPALFSGVNCKSANFGLSKTVPVTAAQAGGSYNLSARNYNSSISGISATGSNMSGGTSKIVKVVTQSDIDGAKQKILDAGSATASAELKQQFQNDNGVPLTETLANSDPKVTSSVAVGEPADQITVTVESTYTMVGVKKDDLGQLIENDAKKHIDTSKQKISNNGIDQANIKVLDKSKPTAPRVAVQTTATAGAEQNADAIRQLVAGKKSGEAKTAIQSRPGIQDVNIKLSPFWVNKIPKKSAKVTVIFQSTNEAK